MSSDDMEYDNNSAEAMQDNTDDEPNDQSSTSQQALKQLNQLTSSGGANPATKVAAVASTSATSNLQKIESKVTIPGTKIVYIKNANGTQPPLRIGGSLISGSQTVSANSTSNSTSVSNAAIQKVQLLQLKNKNVVSSSGSTAANSPRFLLKSGTTQPKFIFSSSGANAKLSTTGSATPRTITVSQAQQMGLIVSSNKSNATTTNAGSSASTKTLILPASSAASAALKNQPTILNKGVKPITSSKILIQSDADGEATTKPVGAPSIVKVAGTGQQVRVLQGKGLQYVRVLNAIPSGNASTSTNKLVNGRQQQVIVQRKIVPQPVTTTQVAAGSKPQHFVTKKLEVMPIGSTAKLLKKEPNTQTAKTPTTFLLNNVQKSIYTPSSIDIKPVTSNQSDSFEITEIKDEPQSPNANKKFAAGSYSLSGDRRSKSPDTNQSNLMYSTLKLPSPEPIEGKIY